MSEVLPAPLTPADCDLRKFPWFQVEIVRLLDSDFFALSSDAEYRAGTRLWFKAWHQVPAGSLPDDERVLASLAGLSVVRWRKVRDMALRGFKLCSDRRWYHPLIAAKALEAWSKSGAQRGRANKRWQRSRANAAALPTQSHRYAGAVQQRGRDISPPTPRTYDGKRTDSAHTSDLSWEQQQERARILRNQATALAEGKSVAEAPMLGRKE